MTRNIEPAADKKKLLFIEDEGYVVDRVNDILKSFPQFEVTNCDNAKLARGLLEDRED